MDETIFSTSSVGQRISIIKDTDTVSYIMFGNKKVDLVSTISIGRLSDNQIVIDSKLASRHHAIIQKIKDAYFLKDLDSTNGTFLNDKLIPKDKYVKLNLKDKITIGNVNLVVS